MKIVVTGGTGFIGSYLLQSLSQQSHTIILLTRGKSYRKQLSSSEIRYVQWDARQSGDWEKEIDGADVVINLAGKNLFEQRWNDPVKQQIIESRVLPLHMITNAIAAARVKPSIVISASAVGYYGDRNDEIVTESSTPGKDFLADVVAQWESAAYGAEQFGVRVVTPRIGVVLQKDGGMISKMLLPFQWFIGGSVGNGNLYLPWIHMTDVVRGILYPIENKSIRGVYNLAAPHPVTMKTFATLFGKALHRPSLLPVPTFAVKILYGEAASSILAGQKVLPEKLLSSGFQFSFPELAAALRNILL